MSDVFTAFTDALATSFRAGINHHREMVGKAVDDEDTYAVAALTSAATLVADDVAELARCIHHDFDKRAWMADVQRTTP